MFGDEADFKSIYALVAILALYDIDHSHTLYRKCIPQGIQSDLEALNLLPATTCNMSDLVSIFLRILILEMLNHKDKFYFTLYFTLVRRVHHQPREPLL